MKRFSAKIKKTKDRIWQREKGRGGHVNHARPNSQGLDTEQTNITSLIHAAPETETSSNVTNTATPPLNHGPLITTDADPCIWADAYDEFARREPELAADYKAYVTSIPGGETALQTGSQMSPAWAKSIVEKLQNNREDKQWHITFHGKSIRFRNQAEKLFKVLLWGDNLVKQALSTQPYAALAWSGVSILLPLLTSGTAQNEAMLSGFDEICGEQIYWKAYEDALSEEVDSRTSQMVRVSLIELYSYIFEYHARVICHLSSTQLSRAWEKVAGWNDWEKKASHVSSLSKQCKDLTESTQRRVAEQKSGRLFEQIYQSREATQRICESLEAERKQRASHHEDQLERGLLAKLAVDHEASKNFHPEKVTGTCEWLLEHPDFLSWRDSQESGLFWVSANPGCGKSVLSRSLIDERQLSTSAATSIVCHFFFRSGDDNRENSYNALSAIIHQLLIQDLTGKFISHALDKHKNYGAKLATSFSELWNILLDCAATPNAGTIICVLDALDECKQDERDIINGELRKFFSTTRKESHLKYKLKFLVTSRPYDTIERSFGKFWNSSCLRIDGDSDERVSAGVKKDINLVIDARIPEIFPNFADNDRHRIAKRLKDMENRTYLWLHLIFLIIEKTPSKHGKPSIINNLLDNLPDEHAEAYEKLLQAANPDPGTDFSTSCLFRLMLAATQPLSVDEANYALTLATAKPPAGSHSSIELWGKDFESSAKTFCGLLVSFHDSKVSFIHKTVRDFLTEGPNDNGKWKWRGRFQLSECHDCMARSCINYLSLPELNEPIQDRTVAENTYPFLSYSSEHWPFHYRELDKDPSMDLLDDARNLCRLTTGGKQWMEAHDKDEFGTWPLWTELALAAYLGMGPVVRAILDEGDANIEAYCGYYGTALQAASAAGFPAVVEILLDEGANINAVSGHYPTAAAAAVLNGHLVLARTFLEKFGAQIDITEEVLVAVINNSTGGKELMALFLKNQEERIWISQRIVRTALTNGAYGNEIITLILDKPGVQINIGPDIAFELRGPTEDQEEMLCLFAEKRPDLVSIFQDDFARFAGYSSLKQVTLLVEKRGDRIEITEDILVAAAGNDSCGTEILSLLSEKYPAQVEITEDILVAAARNDSCGKEILSLLSEKYPAQVEITEDILVAAARNDSCGKEILSLLLEHQESQVVITKKMMVEAAGSHRSGKEIMALLLEYQGDQIDISADVMVMAAKNEDSGKDIMALLLKKLGRQAEITRNVVIAAAGNSLNGNEIMALLLDSYEGQVDITEEVLAIVAKNWGSEGDIMAFLLKYRGDGTKITKNIILGIVNNVYCGKQTMALLFKNLADLVDVTEDVLVAAAGNERHGEDLMVLLLEHCGDRIDITEDLLLATARNAGCGYQIMTLLLERWADSMNITQDVMAELVQSRKGLNITALLFQHQKIQISITEDIVKGLWRKPSDGNKIMALLLGHWKKTTITQNGVRAVAELFGLKHMALLLDRWGEEIRLSPTIMVAAAGNTHHGEVVMALLLEKRPDQVEITQDVVVAAAGNWLCGKEIMALLLEKRPDESG
ncbi:hypothetical protein F4861DRAFT_153240 [Xylaria intraflava]|nr:hypothetical protein F4861DRAFT_153240 [Xylaria intraflava]